ncbi:unnamed protein product [Strongylus vulgaris]|uniref:Uncharacterized protein n=1 Tax=Strongylus vulgaris TaxID=40348 RepID=A0A3P7I7W1_STRVU|nr:unnamed protein product [Strongylus vulgaris]
MDHRNSQKQEHLAFQSVRTASKHPLLNENYHNYQNP